MKTMLKTVSSHIRDIGGCHSTFYLPMSLWDFQNYKVREYTRLMEGLVLLGPYSGDKIVLHPGWLRKGVYLR